MGIAGSELPRSKSCQLRVIDGTLHEPEPLAAVTGEDEDIREISIRRPIGDHPAEAGLCAIRCLQTETQRVGERDLEHVTPNPRGPVRVAREKP